jgi:hypothetical protein
MRSQRTGTADAGPQEDGKIRGLDPPHPPKAVAVVLHPIHWNIKIVCTIRLHSHISFYLFAFWWWLNITIVRLLPQ